MHYWRCLLWLEDRLRNSRDKQYRVRLNESENKILQYVSEMTGKQKSEIFRNALEDYYNKVRVQEALQDILSVVELLKSKCAPMMQGFL